LRIPADETKVLVSFEMMEEDFMVVRVDFGLLFKPFWVLRIERKGQKKKLR
jgi:hypothetical protein